MATPAKSKVGTVLAVIGIVGSILIVLMIGGFVVHDWLYPTPPD